MGLRPKSLIGRLCCYGFLVFLTLILFLLVSVYVFLYEPYTSGLQYEQAVYQQVRTVERMASRPPITFSFKWPGDDEDFVWSKHATDPLIKNVPQLWSWSALKDLHLHNFGFMELDHGYGRGPDYENWIYLAGTNPGPKPSFSLPDVLTRNNGSCVDPPETCDVFNAAFNRLMDQCPVDHYYHPTASFKFANCDVSPAICDHWQSNAVMLVHVKTMQPCRFDFERRAGFVCSVKWSFVTLPLTQMPFQRKVRTAGHVVPAFPSPYEQIRSMIAFPSSEEALRGDERIIVEEYIVDPNETRPKEKIELGAKGDWLNETAYGWGTAAAESYMKIREAVLG